MLGIVAAKQSQGALWETIDKMNAIRQMYNQLISQKL